MCDVTATIRNTDSKILTLSSWSQLKTGFELHASPLCQLSGARLRVPLSCQRLYWRLFGVWWLSQTPPALFLITTRQLCTPPVQWLCCLPSFLCSTSASTAEVMTHSPPWACLPRHLSWPDRATRLSPRAGVGPIWTLFKGNPKESCISVQILVTVICLGTETLHTGLGTQSLFLLLFFLFLCLS